MKKIKSLNYSNPKFKTRRYILDNLKIGCYILDSNYAYKIGKCVPSSLFIKDYYYYTLHKVYLNADLINHHKHIYFYQISILH